MDTQIFSNLRRGVAQTVCAGTVAFMAWAGDAVLEAQVPRPAPARVAAPQTLRQAAERKGLLMGFFMSHYWFLRQGDPHNASVSGPYTELLNRVAGREFNLVAMPVFMSQISPKPNRNDWFYSDYVINYAQRYGMAVQGTPLVYSLPVILPPWVKELEQKQRWEALRAAMKREVSAVVGRYRGKVKSWIVVNEAVDYDASANGWTLAPNVWQKAHAQSGNPEWTYIDEAFNAARTADRDAVLIYNDFANAEVSGKSDFIHTLLKGMKSRKVPVDAVGFQMHLNKEGADAPWLSGGLNIDSFKRNMQRFADLGLDIYITELDMKLEDMSPRSLQRQAEVYAQIVDACRAQPRFKGLLQWGLYDKYNWLNDLPTEKVKPLYPLIYDTACNPKPAYYSLREALTK